MAVPSYVGSDGFGSSFASSLSGSFAVGSDPVSIFAFAVAVANSSLTRVNSITLNPAGTPLVMTALTDRSLNTELTSQGRCRAFEAIASGLTGTVNFTLQCTDLSGVSDGNAKPGVFFLWAKDGESATSAQYTGPNLVAGGTNGSATIASNTNSRVFGIWLTDGVASGMSGQNGTTKHNSDFASDYEVLGLSELGATSTTLEVLTPSTTSFLGQLWSLAGSAASAAHPKVGGPINSPLTQGKLAS